MTDTSKTRAQLIDMALDDLFAAGSGQSPEAEDQQKVDSRFDGLMADLAARLIVSIADDQDIPIEWCGALSELLANECARAFGKEKMPDQMRESIEGRLHTIVNAGDISTYRLKVEPPMKTKRRIGLSLARWTSGV
jgi:hypothetical protein